MAPTNANPATGDGGARQESCSTQNNPANSPTQERAQVIRAELVGSDTCRAEGVTATAAAPVLGLCRLLIAAGHDPDATLEAYRGDVLALRVRTISEGAKLCVRDSRFGTPTIRRRKAPPGVVSASPIERSDTGHPQRQAGA